MLLRLFIFLFFLFQAEGVIATQAETPSESISTEAEKINFLHQFKELGEEKAFNSFSDLFGMGARAYYYFKQYKAIDNDAFKWLNYFSLYVDFCIEGASAEDFNEYFLKAPGEGYGGIAATLPKIVFKKLWATDRKKCALLLDTFKKMPEKFPTKIVPILKKAIAEFDDLSDDEVSKMYHSFFTEKFSTTPVTEQEKMNYLYTCLTKDVAIKRMVLPLRGLFEYKLIRKGRIYLSLLSCALMTVFFPGQFPALETPNFSWFVMFFINFITLPIDRAIAEKILSSGIKDKQFRNKILEANNSTPAALLWTLFHKFYFNKRYLLYKTFLEFCDHPEYFPKCAWPLLEKLDSIEFSWGRTTKEQDVAYQELYALAKIA